MKEEGENVMRKSLGSLCCAILSVLLCAAFTVPAQAGTFTYTIDYNSPKCTSGTLCIAMDAPPSGLASAAGIWYFTVQVTGKVNSLGLAIKDSAPGASDFCWSWTGRNPSGNFGVNTTPTVIPASGTDACGTRWADSNGAPFSLVTYLKTSDPNATVVITVLYPDLVALNGTTFKAGDWSAAGRLRDQYVLGKQEQYDPVG